MRPALGKPGALPFLVLIVFSLLTLVPSLSSIYNLKWTDLSYLISAGTRKLPLIQDGAAFSPDTPPIDPHKAWVMTAPYRTRGSRISRSSRSNGPVTVLGDVTPVENQSRLAASTSASSSFIFGRRARAFRTYFIQQLDDYQLFTSFANRSLPATITPTNVPPPSTSSDDDRSENNDSDNISSPVHASPLDETRLSLPVLCDRWQPACRSAMGFWEYIASPSRMQPLIQLGLKLLKSIIMPSNDVDEQLPPSIHASKDASAVEARSGQAEQTPQSSATSDQATDAAGHTAELRGSCMAVVIGLVAGIMWF